MEWTQWMSFIAKPCYAGPAVYQFRFVVNGHPVPIPRLLGADQDGLLVIGCTGNMDQRSQQSQNAQKSANGSSTINLLYYLERFTSLRHAFPGATYEYRFVRLESVEAAKLLEAKIIKRYVCQFADRPPLNSVLPNRYGGWEEASE